MLTSGQFHGRSDCWQQILAARMIQRIFRGARVRSITRKSRTLAKTARRIQLTLRFTQLRDILNQEMESDRSHEEHKQRAEGVADTLDSDLQEWREWDVRKAQAARNALRVQRRLVRPSELKGWMDACETIDV